LAGEKEPCTNQQRLRREPGTSVATARTAADAVAAVKQGDAPWQF